MYDTSSRRNFPNGYLPPSEPSYNPLVATISEHRENREARERLEDEAADEAYMVELLRLYLGQVEAEQKLYARYAPRKTEVKDYHGDSGDVVNYHGDEYIDIADKPDDGRHRT